MKLKDHLKLGFGSFIAGVCNGLFGAGGGILIVPVLESLKLESKKAHATSVAVIAVFCVFSFIGYFMAGHFNFLESVCFVPSGVVGAIVGVFVLKKIKNKMLKRVFGILIIIASVRLFFK